MKQFKPNLWLNPNGILSPKMNEVHIWFVDINAFSGLGGKYKEILSNKDIERFDAIILEEKKQKSVLRHILLLKVLANYLQKELKDIELYYSESGKPFLSSELDKGELQFNVSNSFNYLLVSLCKGIQIGVDVENIHRQLNYEKLVKRYFSENEQEHFLQIAETLREETFFQWWTIKESVMKSIGKGMRLIHSFEIPTDTNSEKIKVTLDKYEKTYYCYELSIQADCKASICLEKKIQQVKFFKL